MLSSYFTLIAWLNNYIFTKFEIKDIEGHIVFNPPPALCNHQGGGGLPLWRFHLTLRKHFVSFLFSSYTVKFEWY